MEPTQISRQLRRPLSKPINSNWNWALAKKSPYTKRKLEWELLWMIWFRICRNSLFSLWCRTGRKMTGRLWSNLFNYTNNFQDRVFWWVDSIQQAAWTADIGIGRDPKAYSGSILSWWWIKLECMSWLYTIGNKSEFSGMNMNSFTEITTVRNPPISLNYIMVNFSKRMI